MAIKIGPKYSAAELARFPLIFGSLLLAAGVAFHFRDLIPSATEEQRQMVKGSEADRELIREAINKSGR